MCAHMAFSDAIGWMPQRQRRAQPPALAATDMVRMSPAVVSTHSCLHTCAHVLTRHTRICAPLYVCVCKQVPDLSDMLKLDEYTCAELLKTVLDKVCMEMCGGIDVRVYSVCCKETCVGQHRPCMPPAAASPAAPCQSKASVCWL